MLNHSGYRYLELALSAVGVGTELVNNHVSASSIFFIYIADSLSSMACRLSWELLRHMQAKRRIFKSRRYHEET